MSIALSAIVRVSPALRCAHAVLCAVLLAGSAFVDGHGSTALLLAAGVAGTGLRRADVKAARIDISGGGGIRLTVYQHLVPAVHAALCAADGAARSVDGGKPGRSVLLLPGSTLWPSMLLLRLRYDEAGTVPGAAAGAAKAGAAKTGAAKAGAVVWLAVLPDSAPPEVRRRLALAVRAIAARQ